MISNVLETHIIQAPGMLENNLSEVAPNPTLSRSHLWRGLFQCDFTWSVFDSDSCILFKGCSCVSPDSVLLLDEETPVKHISI